MGIVFKPKRPAHVARTVWSYSDGGFDANVWAQDLLGRLHQALGLPLGNSENPDNPYVPWRAKAADCRAWAAVIKKTFNVPPRKIDFALFRDQLNYLRGWAVFLDTCSGYFVKS